MVSCLFSPWPEPRLDAEDFLFLKHHFCIAVSTCIFPLRLHTNDTGCCSLVGPRPTYIMLQKLSCNSSATQLLFASHASKANNHKESSGSFLSLSRARPGLLLCIVCARGKLSGARRLPYMCIRACVCAYVHATYIYNTQPGPHVTNSKRGREKAVLVLDRG